ncbi:MAG TPA: hypothetical protein VGF95_14695 [Solirubrobacteraceae bacterium]|jgi:hypothetical protein
MNELLRAIKEDLTSRRMLPLLVLALGVLAGAVAYAAIGGKTSPSVASTPPASSAPTVPGPSVTSAPENPNAAVAETTNGSSLQHRGHVHNPFKPLPGSEAEASEAGASSGQESASSESSGSTESPGSGGESSPAGGSEEAQPEEQTLSLYEASAKLQQLASTGKPEGEPQLLAQMKQLRPLPSKQQSLFAYVGVASGGNGALFLLLSPAIVHGPAHCLPGPTNCEAIYIKAQQSEELQYLEASGTVVSYKLVLGKLEGVEVPAAHAHATAARLIEEASELQNTLGVSLPAQVHYSEESGLLLGVQDAIKAKSK